MKKLLLFVIACTLGLFGTVSAQETITIGDGTESTYSIADTYEGASGASQQIYTAEEIGSAGTITSIAFNKKNGSDYNRGWSIYLKHIDEEEFTSQYNYKMSSDDLVYEGTFKTQNGWNVFDITPFQYDGVRNLLVTVVDNSHLYGGDQNWYYTAGTIDHPKCLTKYAAGVDVTTQIGWSYFAGRFNIQLTLSAGEGGGEEPEPTPTIPSHPASMTATANGQNSITLTWEAVEGATSYNIYSTAAGNVPAVTATEYTYEGLTAGTQYCFEVTAENAAGESYDAAYACATTEEATEEPEGPVTVTIGEGNYEKNYYAPISNYGTAKYSYSQQIYLKEEIGKDSGLITSIAFHNKAGNSNTRNIVVYMNNVEKSSFESTTDHIAVTDDDIVYQGEFTFGAAESWVTMELQNPFVYTGGNLAITVNDITGATMGYSNYDQFYSTLVTELRGLYGYSSYLIYDCTDLSGNYFYNLQTSAYTTPANTPYVADIQLTMGTLSADVKVEPETIAFGEVQLGEYWSENEATTVDVTIKPISTTITNITCDNDFFVLPTIDLTASTIEFEIAYNNNGAAGEQTGNLTITYGDGATKVVPMTATAYAPATADVFELAQEITFTENAYTDTPVFANLKDDYNLPAEDGANAPDAVYAFELTKESIVAVEVTGTNANYAIYRAEDLAGNGPKADNNYTGESVASENPTSFFYNFSEENVLDNFTLIDKDEDGYNWAIASYGIDGLSLKSDSYLSQGYKTLYPDNYIVTKEKYEITANSVLSFKHLTSQYPDKFGVEVSADGETFTSVWSGKFNSNGSIIEQVVSLSDYAGQSLYIALRHYESNGSEGFYVLIDDLRLESGLPSVFPAGKYYLVAAAEDEFTVNVAVEALETEEPTPAEPVYRLESITYPYSWDNLSYVYESETSDKVLQVLVGTDDYGYGQYATVINYDENGVITGTEYKWRNSDGTLTSSNWIRNFEYIYTDGVLTSYIESDYYDYQDPDSTTYTLAHDAEGNVTEVASETSKVVYAYENGKLVGETKYYYDENAETPGFVVEYEVEYAYDENGNCVAATQYQLYDTVKVASKCTEYFYDLTVTEDVYTFAYPHEVKPATANVLVAALSYEYYEDYNTGELQKSNFGVKTYNYNIEVEEVHFPPMGLYAITHDASQIFLSWTAIEDAEKFYVYANGEFMAERTDMYYYAEGLDPYTEYCFTVVAVNGELELESEPVCAKTLDLGIVAPVVTAEVAETTVTLTWNVVENALSYNVYQGETLLGNVTETTYTVEGLTAETTYSFTVSAVRNEQEVTSEVVTVTTEAAPAPVAKAYRLESVADAFSAKSYVYDEELTNRVVEVEEDFVPTVISYNEAGQIESAIVYAEETDSIGNPIEFSSTRYTYNEDGVWVGYTEVAQGWMGLETTEATLNYNENGQLVSLVTDELKREITYNEAGLIAEVLTSKTTVEEEDGEGDGGFDDGGVVLASDDEVEEDGTVEETVMFTDKNVFEYDAEGRLIKKSTYIYYDEFVLGEVEEYKYDENGNCVSMETYEADEETGELRAYPWIVSQYFYDLTINNEDVYSFEYPHLAFINWVEPSHVNILTKVLNYTQSYNDETENMEMGACDVKVYNYNPAVLSAPFTPMNITVEATSATSVELSWAGFADAESFVIYSADTVCAETEDPYYTVEGLELGVEYCFSVQAVNAVGTSEISAPVCITIELPAAPANLVAEATSDTTIALTWEEVPGIWEYNVYKVVKSEEETTYEFVGQAWGFNYTVEGLEAETEYSFVVKSTNNIGESAASNVATATTLKAEEDEPIVPEPVVPAAPVVAVDTVTETTVVLTWAAVEGALSYNVYQGADSIANVTDTTFTVTGLTADTEYSFTVTAVNEAGESEASNVATAKTLKGEGIAENAVAFNIYPNPATDRVVIATEATIEAVTIYSMTGVMVYSEVDFNNNTINVSDFASGVYFIKVRTENGEAVQRFIKK